MFIFGKLEYSKCNTPFCNWTKYRHSRFSSHLGPPTKPLNQRPNPLDVGRSIKRSREAWLSNKTSLINRGEANLEPKHGK